jgi:hypothetical protein
MTSPVAAARLVLSATLLGLAGLGCENEVTTKTDAGTTTDATMTDAAMTIDSSTSYGTPQDCIEAGGQCILGPGISCAKRGPENTCNCNPLCSTGGQFCCVAFIDGGDAEVL